MHPSDGDLLSSRKEVFEVGFPILPQITAFISRKARGPDSSSPGPSGAEPRTRASNRHGPAAEAEPEPGTRAPGLGPAAPLLPQPSAAVRSRAAATGQALPGSAARGPPDRGLIGFSRRRGPRGPSFGQTGRIGAGVLPGCPDVRPPHAPAPGDTRASPGRRLPIGLQGPRGVSSPPPIRLVRGGSKSAESPARRLGGALRAAGGLSREPQDVECGWTALAERDRRPVGPGPGRVLRGVKAEAHGTRGSGAVGPFGGSDAPDVTARDLAR